MDTPAPIRIWSRVRGTFNLLYSLICDGTMAPPSSPPRGRALCDNGRRSSSVHSGHSLAPAWQLRLEDVREDAVYVRRTHLFTRSLVGQRVPNRDSVA